MADRYYYVPKWDAYFRLTDLDHVWLWYTTMATAFPLPCYSARKNGFVVMPMFAEEVLQLSGQ